ncbi:MAG: methylthioribulose 1-phosphate dehydratase [Acidobacteria bacterium]|nr:MAG: methylthioribulose 1-phosphate dehydratase [Acidobacteriota bacterium]
MTKTVPVREHDVKDELAAPGFPILARALAEVSRNFYDRGWVMGTSGNFSAVVSRDPLRLAITSTGADKGLLSVEQIVQIDPAGKTIEGSRRPSDEARLHLAIVRKRGAGAVLHTHSIWATLLSEIFAKEGGIDLEGYEMLKGLARVRTHAHKEWIPLIENAQDVAVLSRSVEDTLEQHPNCHGFLIRRHGLYTWGQDLVEAKRHVEILEFLFEVVGRTMSASAKGL